MAVIFEALEGQSLPDLTTSQLRRFYRHDTRVTLELLPAKGSGYQKDKAYTTAFKLKWRLEDDIILSPILNTLRSDIPSAHEFARYDLYRIGPNGLTDETQMFHFQHIAFAQFIFTFINKGLAWIQLPCVLRMVGESCTRRAEQTKEMRRDVALAHHVLCPAKNASARETRESPVDFDLSAPSRYSSLPCSPSRFTRHSTTLVLQLNTPAPGLHHSDIVSMRLAFTSARQPLSAVAASFSRITIARHAPNKCSLLLTQYIRSLPSPPTRSKCWSILLLSQKYEGHLHERVRLEKDLILRIDFPSLCELRKFISMLREA